MSNVIGFLESAGRDAVLRHARSDQVLHSIQREEIEPAIRALPLQSERMAIDGLLGVRDTMCLHKTAVPPKSKKAPPMKSPGNASSKQVPKK